MYKNTFIKDKKRKKMKLIIFISIGLLIPVMCYKVFQNNIPNGDRVPHPCKKGEVWDGVGHKNALGSGTRNSFGVDFEKNGKVS